jgi:sugar phosphate isomerase/epimerase
MLKTGIISTAYFGFKNFEQGMKKCRAHGYDGIDYQEFVSVENSPIYKMKEGEAERYLTELKDCADANGLEIYQLHGAWPHVDDRTKEGRERTIEYFKQNILGAEILGCPKVIVHPCMPRLGLGNAVEEEDFEVNAYLLKSLAPFAREHGVTVCFENMPFVVGSLFSKVSNIKKLMTEIRDPNIKVCLDTGHFNVEKKDICEAITLLGDDLATLHVHDDRFGQDRHLLPFQGEIDWSGFVRGLRNISYKGFISLETSIQQSTPEPMLEEMRISLAKIAKWFAAQVDDE